MANEFGHIRQGITNYAAHVTVRDNPKLSADRYMTTIGYDVPQDVTFSSNDNVRRFRLLPSADMRYCVDAQSDAERDANLYRNAARTSSASNPLTCRVALASVWSDWQEYSLDDEDDPLSKISFSLDAAGTGATVIVEAE